MKSLIKLMIDKDTAGMNMIVDESFTLTRITGYVQPKNEWFAEIESESMKYYSATKVQATVKIEGNHAVCILEDLSDARIWGSRNT